MYFFSLNIKHPNKNVSSFHFDRIPFAELRRNNQIRWGFRWWKINSIRSRLHLLQWNHSIKAYFIRTESYIKLNLINKIESMWEQLLWVAGTRRVTTEGKEVGGQRERRSETGRGEEGGPDQIDRLWKWGRCCPAMLDTRRCMIGPVPPVQSDLLRYSAGGRGKVLCTLILIRWGAVAPHLIRFGGEGGENHARDIFLVRNTFFFSFQLSSLLFFGENMASGWAKTKPRKLNRKERW